MPPAALFQAVRFWLILLCGAVAGFAGSWWINRPEPPWLWFPEVNATYVPGTRVVDVSGRYVATKTCAPTDGEPNPLIWRQEVEGSGPELVQYAPRPAPPDLIIGEHGFQTEIPLTEGIAPDGWEVSILVTCTNEPFAIRSNAARVRFLPKQATQ